MKLVGWGVLLAGSCWLGACSDSVDPSLSQYLGDTDSAVTTSVRFEPPRRYLAAGDTAMVQVNYDPIFRCSRILLFRLEARGDTVFPLVQLRLPAGSNTCALAGSEGVDSLVPWAGQGSSRRILLVNSAGHQTDSTRLVADGGAWDTLLVFRDTVLQVHRDSTPAAYNASRHYALRGLEILRRETRLAEGDTVNYAYFCLNATGDSLWARLALVRFPGWSALSDYVRADAAADSLVYRPWRRKNPAVSCEGYLRDSLDRYF